MPFGLAMALALTLGISAGTAQTPAKAAPTKGPPPKVAPPKAPATPKAPTTSTMTPDGQLLLVPGRQLKIKLVDGNPVIVGESAAPRDPVLVANPNANIGQWAALGDGELPKDPDVISFTLRVDPVRGSKLVVANGEPIGILYAAVLLVSRNGGSSNLAINTCSIPTNSAGVETWAALDVDSIMIRKVGVTPNPICYDAAADRFVPQPAISPEAAPNGG